MEIGLQSLRPGLITFLRIMFGAVALFLVPRARRTRVLSEDLPRVALLGVTWMALPLLLFPIAQQWIDSSVAGMINGAVPLTAALWSTLLLGRLPPRVQVLGLSVGFVGILAVSLPELPLGRIVVGGTVETALGTTLVFLAVVLYGLSTNLAVPLQQRYGSLAVLLRAQVAALVIVTPAGLYSLPGSSFEWGPVLAMVPLGVLGTGVAFVLMTMLVGRVGGPRGSVAIYFVPIVAMALGALLLGEEIHPLALFGTGLILAGAWVASRRERTTPVSDAARST